MMPTALDESDLKLPTDGPARLEALDAWGRALDTTAQAYASEVQRAVGDILAASKHFQAWWRRTCDEILAGGAAAAHSRRERILGVFEGWCHVLREARDRMRHASSVVRQELPEAEPLEKEVAALEKKLNKLTSRWQTAEDLEDLAAESLALPMEKLKAIRQKLGFPQAWYDDDSVPF